MIDPPIRDAASIIVLRRDGPPAVLMGQRGAGAAFMPGKFVFPGGAVDPGDAGVRLALTQPCAARLSEASRQPPAALAAAAIRELWEETGLILGHRSPWPDPPPGWADLAATGHRPSADALQFVFRAVTPPGRPRPFDARFFLAPATELARDPDDFSDASDELSHLQWVPLAEARRFDLPFITEIILAEVQARLDMSGAPPDVPFFLYTDETPLVLRLGRVSHAF